MSKIAEIPQVVIINAISESFFILLTFFPIEDDMPNEIWIISLILLNWVLTYASSIPFAVSFPKFVIT